MKDTEISKMTIEDLNKRNESLKQRTGVLVGILVILFCTGIFATYLDFKLLPILITAVVFVPLVIVSFSQIKSVTTEISRRNK